MLTANDQMSRIGDALKQRRKELNLSLRDAEKATSIRLNFLQAIEEGESSRLISPVYAKGFIKHYATFLGEDGDKIIRENQEVFDYSSSQEFAYGIGTMEKRKCHNTRSSGMSQKYIYLGLVVVTILAWYFAKYLQLI